MRVVVVVDARLEMTPDGRVWCTNQFNFPHSFWQRYLMVFEKVLVVARVRQSLEKAPEWRELTGPGVEVYGLPYYLGLKQYLRSFFKLRKALNAIATADNCYILRVPSVLSDIIGSKLRRKGIPYGVEVVGDPWEVFSEGIIQHPLRPFFRWWFSLKLKEVCKHASASSYVTSTALQTRYPSPKAKLSISASSIELKEDAISTQARLYHKVMRLIFVGTLEQYQKGADILIQAVAKIPQVELRLIGEGRTRPELEKLAHSLDVGNRVKFLGALPAGEAIRNELDMADIFVLPSRGEGLPRAMIEAMARGMFCVGTQIGGIQELLEPQWCVPVNDSQELARVLLLAIANPDAMNQSALKNLQRAKEFKHDILTERRTKFYSTLRDDRISHG